MISIYIKIIFTVILGQSIAQQRYLNYANPTIKNALGF